MKKKTYGKRTRIEGLKACILMGLWWGVWKALEAGGTPGLGFPGRDAVSSVGAGQNAILAVLGPKLLVAPLKYSGTFL